MRKDRRPNIATLVGDFMQKRTYQWHGDMTENDWQQVAEIFGMTPKKAKALADRDGYLFLMPCNQNMLGEIVFTCKEEAMERIGTRFGSIPKSVARRFRSAMVGGYSKVFVPALRTDVVWFKGADNSLERLEVPEWMCGYHWELDALLERCDKTDD